MDHPRVDSDTDGHDRPACFGRGTPPHLTALAENTKQQDQLGFPNLSRCWAIGTRGWTETLARQHCHLTATPGLASGDIKTLRESQWQRVWEEMLTNAGSNSESITGLPRPRKIALAAALRRRAGASYAWIAAKLELPSASLRMQVHRLLQVSP